VHLEGVDRQHHVAEGDGGERQLPPNGASLGWTVWQSQLQHAIHPLRLGASQPPDETEQQAQQRVGRGPQQAGRWTPSEALTLRHRGEARHQETM
jgi:hypothetical protein